MDNNLQDKLSVLKKGYLKKLDSIILSLKDILSDPEKIDVDGLYSIIHNIAGTSGIYGLKELSKLATDFEFHLKEIKKNTSFQDETELRNELEKIITDIEKTVTEGV